MTVRARLDVIVGGDRATSHPTAVGRRVVPCPCAGESSTLQTPAQSRAGNDRRPSERRSGSQNPQEHSQAGEAPMKILIIVEKTKTGYSAYSPDIDGCVATGATRQQVERRMRSALAFHFEGMGD